MLRDSRGAGQPQRGNHGNGPAGQIREGWPHAAEPCRPHTRSLDFILISLEAVGGFRERQDLIYIPECLSEAGLEAFEHYPHPLFLTSQNMRRGGGF